MGSQYRTALSLSGLAMIKYSSKILSSDGNSTYSYVKKRYKFTSQNTNKKECAQRLSAGQIDHQSFFQNYPEEIPPNVFESLTYAAQKKGKKVNFRHLYNQNYISSA